MNEFPDEHITVSLGKLFCSACRETLVVKKSTVLNHVTSSKHLMSKEKLKSKKARQESITMSLKKYDSSGRHESDTICDAHRVCRIKSFNVFYEGWSAHFKIERYSGRKFYMINRTIV